MKYYQRMGFHNISHVLAQIAKLRFVNGEDISDDLYALSCEPDLRVRLFSACLVHGVRYHTVDRERKEEPRIVESWLKVHMMVIILIFMVS